VSSNGELYNGVYQKPFINFAMRDSEFLLSVKDDLNPELFSDDVSQRLIRIILDFVEREKAAPGTLIFHLLDSLRDRKVLSTDIHKLLSEYAEQLFGYPLQNKRFLLDEYERFVKSARFRKVIFPVTDLAKKGEFDRALEMLTDVLSFSPKKDQDLGRALDPDPTLRIERREREDEQRLWTFIRELDRQVPGLKKKEFGVLLSQRSSGGKSAALAFFARSFAFQGKKVLYYALELSEEEIEDRLDQCIVGLTQSELINRQAIVLRLTKMFRQFGGNIWIKQFPPGTTTVKEIREHKRRLEKEQGFVADVVLLDPLYQIRPDGIDPGDLFSGLLQVATAVKAMAVEDDIPVWTVMQSHREAMSAVRADMEHMGLSIGIVWVANTIISINRSPDEQERGITELYVVKSQNSRARFPIRIKTDFERMQFYKGPAHEED
jgi:hypothetical protein